MAEIRPVMLHITEVDTAFFPYLIAVMRETVI